MSSQYSNAFPVSNVYDGNELTMASTLSAETTDQWITVRVPDTSSVGFVAVYNRVSNDIAQCWLMPYEVWMGSQSNRFTQMCSGSVQNPPCDTSMTTTMGPYLTQCGGRNDLPYVTIVIRSGHGSRHLTPGEVKVYQYVVGQSVEADYQTLSADPDKSEGK